MKLPQALKAHRLRRGMSQKALALTVGIDQARLSELERGRRSSPPPALLTRLSRALGLNEQQSHEVSWAAEHDRLVREVAAGPCAKATDLVSAALWAAPVLSPSDINGLTRLLTSKAAIDAELRQLDALGPLEATLPKEVPVN